MSDWFNDPRFDYTPATGDDTPAEATPTPDTPAPADTPSVTTPPSAAETTPVTDASPAQTTPTGWQSAPGAWSSPVQTPPTPPVGDTTPPTPPTYSAPSGWQSQPSGGYTPPQSPYGWTPQPTPPQKPPKKKRGGAAVLIALLAVVCLTCFTTSILLIGGRMNIAGESGESGESGSSGNSGNSSGDTGNADAPTIVTADPEEEGLSSRDIVAANLDSTVIIKMYVKSTGGFFMQETGEESEAGEATGIVWTADGYIITNAHCVYNEDTGSEYDRIEVELYDGTIYENATIVGYDTTTDLAVLKVDATALTPAAFGDSDALALGDRVIALGNNSGLGWTVTQGVVSGLARDVYEETNYAIKCLQVDAAINPGNSGGPLLNSSGQVIAINSAKIVASGYEGLGFSIPINEASEILQDLVSHGYVKGRIMLGIEGYTFNRYTGYEGFYISSINTDSCFVGTAARVGDIITHVNSTRVTSYAEMREQLTSYNVGDTVTLTLIRISRNSRQVETFDISIELMESDGSV